MMTHTARARSITRVYTHYTLRPSEIESRNTCDSSRATSSLRILRVDRGRLKWKLTAYRRSLHAHDVSRRIYKANLTGGGRRETLARKRKKTKSPKWRVRLFDSERRVCYSYVVGPTVREIRIFKRFAAARRPK